MARMWVRRGIVAAAVLTAYLPVSPELVEHYYSAGAYVTLQRVLTPASNAVPIALFDGLVAIVVGGWSVLAWRDARRPGGRLRAMARIAWRSIVWSAALYLAFVITWGLNYRRAHFPDKLPYDGSAVSAPAALAAARVAVDRANALHAGAHAAGWPPRDDADPNLAAAFARALHELRLPSSFAVARPKASMMDWYFRRSGTSGMTDPYFLETLIASDVLPVEQPFTIAHEWGHLAGVADEGEANLVAVVTCLRGGVGAQYSGWLFLYRELAGTAAAPDRAVLARALASGPRDDVRAIRERTEREVSPRISAAGWRVYDSYLRANRVDAGAASYAEVVKLVLGLRIDGHPIVAP